MTTASVDTCPTPCDPDCTTSCHERHKAHYHRSHDPDECDQRQLGGGLVSARLNPVAGAEQIAHFMADLAGRLSRLTLLERTVNGQPGLVAQRDGVTVSVYAFDIVGDRITHIWSILNPEKLRPWTKG